MPKRSLISADNHVFEPVTLWQERLPKEYRDRGPRVEHRAPVASRVLARRAARTKRACARAGSTSTAGSPTWRSTA